MDKKKDCNAKIYIFESSDKGELSLSLDKTQESSMCDGSFIKVDEDTLEALEALLTRLATDTKAKK